MNITPAPTDEEAAAIVAAIELAWPRSVVVAAAPVGPMPTSAWKWSGRWWSKSSRPAGDRRRP